MTQGPDPRTPTAVGGVGYASFLLGAGSSGSISHQIRPANANRYFAFYLQDDFKVARKLTLNAGLRWDFESGTTERHDQLSAIDPLVRNPISDKAGFDVKGGIIFAPTTLGRRTIRNTDPRQINPRLGLVYELNPKTVIRAGYGIFFGLPSYAANSNYTGGAFNSSTPWLTSLDGIGSHHQHAHVRRRHQPGKCAAPGSTRPEDLLLISTDCRPPFAPGGSLLFHPIFPLFNPTIRV